MNLRRIPICQKRSMEFGFQWQNCQNVIELIFLVTNKFSSAKHNLFSDESKKRSQNVAIGPLAQPKPKNGDENNVTNHQALPKPNPGLKLVTKKTSQIVATQDIYSSQIKSLCHHQVSMGANMESQLQAHLFIGSAHINNFIFIFIVAHKFRGQSNPIHTRVHYARLGTRNLFCCFCLAI